MTGSAKSEGPADWQHGSELDFDAFQEFGYIVLTHDDFSSASLPANSPTRVGAPPNQRITQTHADLKPPGGFLHVHAHLNSLKGSIDPQATSTIESKGSIEDCRSFCLFVNMEYSLTDL